MTTKEQAPETWQNVTAGRVVINRIDHRGELTKTNMIDPGKKFSLTTQERRMNQELAATPEMDVFANGALMPVKILDSVEDAREIAENPNLMGESDMRALMKHTVKIEVFRDAISGITNPAALERLLAMAEEEDATISKVAAVRGQLQQQAPEVFINERVVVGGPKQGPPQQRRSKAVTPS